MSLSNNFLYKPNPKYNFNNMHKGYRSSYLLFMYIYSLIYNKTFNGSTNWLNINIWVTVANFL